MNRQPIRHLVIVGVAFLLGFLPVAFAQTPIPVAQPVQRGAQPSINYKLRSKDTVHIKVFGEDELESTGRIDKDGYVFFPLLAKAKIGGETVQEATDTMVSLLHKYLINPQVEVDIVTYSKDHFTILGQVTKPGTFDFPDEGSINLLEALGLAGGYTKIANPAKIDVKRFVDGRQQVIHVDGRKLINARHSGEPVFQIMAGDIIQVGEALF